MRKKTQKQIRIIERAIDRLVDVQDEGFGCEEIASALSKLNDLLYCEA